MSETIINSRYRIVKELGHGGMGTVRLVEDAHHLSRLLALKTLIPGAAGNQSTSFQVEFGELAKLTHPNLAKAYDFGVVGSTGEQYFTTEFIRGVSLLEGTRGATPDQILDVTAQILRGLDFLHTHGLLHNDLKPANILLSEAEESDLSEIVRLERAVFGSAGRIKIIDFGLLSKENVAWRGIQGTPQYISPERIRMVAADRRADLYSLGCVLYHICTGRFPFQANTIRDMLRLHLQAIATPVRDLRNDLPEPLVRLIAKLMEKQPRDRLHSARESLRFLATELGWDRRCYEVESHTPPIGVGALLFRTHELAILEERLAAALRGDITDSCVLIEGPEGIGKSRLVEELRGSVQTRGGAFAEVRGEAARGHLRPVLASLIGALKTRGGEDVAEVEQLLTHEAADGADDSRGELSCRLQEVILAQAAKRPVVFHFDDFQRASMLIRRFVLELINSADEESKKRGRLHLLILVSRRNQRKGRYALTATTRLRVPELSTEQSREFLQRAFSQDEIPRGVIGVLSGLGRGIPALLLELAGELVRRKHVRYHGSRWDFPETLEGIVLPDSVGSVIESRVADLSDKPREIMEWMTLCPSATCASRLGRCVYLSTAEARSHLAGLVRSGLVYIEQQEDVECFGLAHQDTRHVLAKGIGDDRRREMHHRLAQNIESEAQGCGQKRRDQGGEPEGKLAEELAYHWLEASNLPAFRRYAPAAAAYLAECGNFPLAVDYHRRLAEAMPDGQAGKKIKSLIRLSEMHEFLWDLDHSAQNLSDILELGGALLKAGDRAALFRRLAAIEVSRQNNAAALHHLEEAKSLLGSTPRALEALSLLAVEAWARWFAVGASEGAVVLELAESLLAEDPGDDPLSRTRFVSASQQLAHLYFHLGNLEKAAVIYENNLTLLADTDQRQARAAGLCSLGSVLLARGQGKAAMERLTEAMEAGRQLGDLRILCRTRERIGEYHLLYGDLKRALQITRLGLEEAKSIRHRSATANSLRLLGRIHLRAAQWSDAGVTLERALRVHDESGDPTETSLSCVHLARLHVLRGETERALPFLARADEEASRWRLKRTSALVALLRAECQLRSTGRLDDAVVGSAQESLEACGYVRDALAAGLLLARCALESGDASRAHEELRALPKRLHEVGSWEQKGEHTLLTARLQLVHGKDSTARETLQQLRSWSRNSILPDLTRRAEELLQTIEPTAVPTDAT